MALITEANKRKKVIVAILTKCDVPITDEVVQGLYKYLLPIPYNLLVRSIVIEEKNDKKLTLGQLSLKYSLDIDTIKNIVYKTQ